MGDYTFWLGLAAAIPLSVMANLLTPSIQRYLEARSKGMTLKQRKQLLSEYACVVKFRDDRGRFLEYLVLVVVRTTYIGAVTSIGISLFAYGPKLLQVMVSQWKIDFQLFTLLPSAFLTVACAAAISKLCSEALEITRGVRRFSEYQADVCRRLGCGSSEDLIKDAEESEKAYPG